MPDVIQGLLLNFSLSLETFFNGAGSNRTFWEKKPSSSFNHYKRGT